MHIFALILALLWATPGLARDPMPLPSGVPGQALRTPLVTENLTRGFRFRPPFWVAAVAPSDPNIIYVGTDNGYIYVSRDGGMSWEEFRVRTRNSPFYGAIRPAPTPSITSTRLFRRKEPRLASYLTLDYAFRGPSTEPDPPTSVNGEAKPLADSAGSFGGGINSPDPSSKVNGIFADGTMPTRWTSDGGGGGDGARLGVGLRAGSPWLTLALRKKRRWAIGINMKQTLALKTSPPTGVYWLSVNPDDPDDIFAATQDGLLRSVDGGLTWPTVLTGATPSEREMLHITRSPHDPRTLALATGAGLFMSRDGGDTFARVVDGRVAQYSISWIEFHPTDPDTFYVGTTSAGMFRTKDGGENFTWVYIRTWPHQNYVTIMGVDKSAPSRVLMGTRDGLFVSEDEGETFERAGGLTFVGDRIKALSASGKPGHFMLATFADLWETFDGGKTWSVKYFGANEWTINYAFFDPTNPEQIWVITWAEILRLKPAKPQSIPRDLVQRWRALLAEEPSSAQAIQKALTHAGIWREDLNDYRSNSRFKGLIPKVEAGYYTQSSDVDKGRRSAVLGAPTTPGGGLGGDRQYVWDPQLIQRDFWWVMGRWDLKALFFNADEIPTGRVESTIRYLERMLRLSVLDMYLERRRLQLEQMMGANDSPRANLMRNLRLEELTAHLNVLTGGIFKPYQAL